MVPVAFVSEHSETLVELDIEYAQSGARSRVCRDYIRVPTVRAHPKFIEGLAELVLRADVGGRRLVSGSGGTDLSRKISAPARARMTVHA